MKMLAGDRLPCTITPARISAIGPFLSPPFLSGPPFFSGGNGQPTAFVFGSSSSGAVAAVSVEPSERHMPPPTVKNSVKATNANAATAAPRYHHQRRILRRRRV